MQSVGPQKIRKLWGEKQHLGSCLEISYKFCIAYTDKELGGSAQSHLWGILIKNWIMKGEHACSRAWAEGHSHTNVNEADDTQGCVRGSQSHPSLLTRGEDPPCTLWPLLRTGGDDPGKLHRLCKQIFVRAGWADTCRDVREGNKLYKL